MTNNSNGTVILITLLNILVYKLQKLQEAQQTRLEEAEKNKLEEEEKRYIQEAEETNSLPFSVPTLCRRFALKVIQLATNNFSEELVIGKGGFGNVYKGIIDFRQREVAIKRRKFDSKQGINEFRSEIEMLTRFQHSHIVALIGYCDDDAEMILVYEYLPGESLTDHLYKRARRSKPSLSPLSWVQRLKIVIGAARGLDYLHTGTGIENRVIHRDIKTSNILLDENLAAKLSDFGLSKIGPANQTCTYVSTRVKGTTGYIDPYYFSTHRLTRKSDVYAFGVVLFEVLSGRPAVDTSLNEEQINLAEWAQHCLKVGLLDKIIDSNINGDISSDSLNAYVDVAIKCLHSQPKHRPTMAEVVVGLESALTLQERSTHYSLVEIIPTDSTIEDEDCSIPEVKSTNHKLEQAGDMMVNSSNGWHHKKQSSSRMKIIRRVSGLLSFTARAFSVNGDAKTSGYKNRNSFLSLHHWVRRKPWNQEEVLQSSKLKRFSLNDISKATNKFDSVLGEGGFGRVYKGWVKENTFAAAKWGTGLGIAVKSLHGSSAQGYKEWLAEIKFLGELSHPNIIELIGYCLEGKQRLLVFEFMPHGSLDKHLFKRGSHFKPLSWKLRTSIALGAAKGLAYLHSAEANVIYRDLKTANILIDSRYNAKLSDFGFAKYGPEEDQSHVSTRIAGTIGYLAPESAIRGGTLADHLYKRVRQGDTSLPPLLWVQRLKICIGAARGLHYLHTGTGIQHRIIHRDVKTTNILLDENYAAKVSDFGLSKTSPANQATTYISTHVKGTFGYLDPYYYQTLRLTWRSDVYSFGVVLFEVLCGRPAVDHSLDEEQMGLAGWAQHCFREERLGLIIDPGIKRHVLTDSLDTFVKLAIQCLHTEPKHRPTMAEVVVGLESALALQEKSREYYLPELTPSDENQEEKDISDIEVESENYENGEDDIASNRHQEKQSSAMKKFFAFLTVTAQTITANREAKAARNSGVLEAILKSSKLKSYTFNDLSVATRNFHPDSVLGKTHYGTVFRGWVDENTFAAAKRGTGLVIAIKRYNNEVLEADKLLTEINSAEKLCHPNIVKLIGYCIDKNHRLLVYEYMPQGSLFTHLFRRDSGDSDFQPLSWKHRISIALGAAKGLAYLHSSEVNMIHHDVKTSNILIDSKYNAKLSGFWGARAGPIQCRTTVIQGTLGYLDPEYFHTGQVRMKSDVYSFGVVLLEILTGRKPIDPAENTNLATWAHSRLREEYVISDIMDADIKGQYTVREALKAFSLALKCTSLYSKSRPDAKQVVEELEQLLASVN